MPLEALPEGALIGTSSRRRAYQIALHYPHLRTEPIRGNVETRMGKVDAGLFDATLLAEAGLTRLDMKDVTRYPISEEIIVPAPGQAAIAVQTRDEDGELQTLLQQIHDAKTEREVTIERSLLKRLGGGCALPWRASAISRARWQSFVSSTRTLRGRSTIWLRTAPHSLILTPYSRSSSSTFSISPQHEYRISRRSWSW